MQSVLMRMLIEVYWQIGADRQIGVEMAAVGYEKQHEEDERMMWSQ